MTIYSLFPTALGKYFLDRAITEEEFNFIKNLPLRNNIGNKTSVDFYILKNENLKSLNKFIVESLNKYFKEVYGPNDDVQIYITQSWLNFTDTKQFHHRHTHPNSIVSGVFYIQTDPQLDRIYFSKNGNKKLEFTKNFNIYNSESWWFETEPNSLLLFPSDLTHEVKPVETNLTRISLSFNTYVRGKFGTPESLNYLELGN